MSRISDNSKLFLLLFSVILVAPLALSQQQSQRQQQQQQPPPPQQALQPPSQHLEQKTAQRNASADLNALLASIETFQAQFQQRIVDEDNDEIQAFTGTLSIKKPGKMLWQAMAPVRQTVITNNKQLYFYDADLEQLTIQPFSGDISRTPALLLSGEVEKLAATFKIVRLMQGNAEAHGATQAKVGKEQTKVGKKVVQAKEAHFELRPLASDSLFERLTVKFLDGQIVELNMTDSLQQKTRIVFSGAQRNVKIDDAIFEFVAPAGTDIIVND